MATVVPTKTRAEPLGAERSLRPKTTTESRQHSCLLNDSANDDGPKAVSPDLVPPDEHLGSNDKTEGEFRSFMKPTGRALAHEAGPLLLRYATTGCPVDCGRPWTPEEMQAGVEKGPHISALNPEAAAQFRQECHEKQKQGFCRIVKWSTLKKQGLPTNLKISPIAAVPHKSRNWRAILDLSFQLQVGGKRLTSVNESSKSIAPPEALEFMGDALPRLIEAVALAPEADGIILFSKLDLKDGYWRMSVEEGEEWNFAYVLPPPPDATDHDVEIVVPSALQMGWSESPPFFCAASETARDVAEDRCNDPVGSLPAHKLEHYLLPPGKWTDESIPTRRNKLKKLLECYVDDFCTMVQSTNAVELRHITRALLHSIHEVFPPEEATGYGGGDSVSVKKLLQGDGVWDTRKELLGWIFDGVTRCIELPKDKTKLIAKTIKSALRRKGLKFKDYEKLLGKIRHAAIGVPGSNGLFTPLNMVLSTKKHRWIDFRKRVAVADALGDFRALLLQSAAEPTHTRELVPGAPAYVGHCDACMFGAGGVWHSGTDDIPPLVWRVPFPPEIQREFITRENPKGSISISDLEMAGLLLHYIVLEYIVDVRHKHVGAFCDNTPTVSWAAKLASKRSRCGGRLLRALALRQRVSRSSPLLTVSIAGVDNDMADIASRSFKGGGAIWKIATDDEFVLNFNTRFPLPQKEC